MTFLAGLFLGILVGTGCGAYATWRFLQNLAKTRINAPAGTKQPIPHEMREVGRALRRREPARFVEPISPKEERESDLQKKVRDGIHPSASDLEEEQEELDR